jgi:adhesin/invasin
MPLHRLLVLAALTACATDSSTGLPDETVVSLHAGTSQTAFANATVPIRPSVLVTARGEPVAGVTVTFRVTQGGGTVQGATQVTGTDGIARVEGWTLGPIGPQALEAIIGDALGSPVIFAATAVQSVPAVIEVVRGSGTSGTVGLPVTETPMLRVTDASGRPVAGLPVSWTITAGGGGFRYADNVTDANGRAAVVKWILGTVAGTNAVTARVDCGAVCAPITFTSSGAAGAVHAMQLATGDLQRVPPGVPVPVAPAIRIRDGYNNPTPGRVVVFTVVQGGGSIKGATATSDANGIARVEEWILGPGENLLRAEAEGLSVLFRATGAQ